MNIILMFIIFVFGIIIHELSHILTYWYLFDDWAKVRFSKTTIRIIPNKLMNKKEKQLFLGVPIITGMFGIGILILFYPVEASLALIGYLISSGMDFWNLIKLEVKEK